MCVLVLQKEKYEIQKKSYFLWKTVKSLAQKKRYTARNKFGQKNEEICKGVKFLGKFLLEVMGSTTKEVIR